MSFMDVQCPFCRHQVEVDIAFAVKNGRIMCGTCCKSFDIQVKSQVEEVQPPPEQQISDFESEGGGNFYDNTVYEDEDDICPF